MKNQPGTLGHLMHTRGMSLEEAFSYALEDPSDAKLPASSKSGFRQPWGVQEYEIRDGALCNTNRAVRTRYFFPVLAKELPERLVKIHEGNEADLLRFAKRYGQLGHDLLVRNEDRRYGDPLPWIWTHVRSVRACMSLIEKIQTDDLDGLQDFFAAHKTLDIALRGQIKPLVWGSVTSNFRSVALWIVQNIINPNIAGIHRVIDIGEANGPYRSFFTHSALIEMVYWHLADAIDGGTVKRCSSAGCGAYFIATDRRQRFCSPDNPKTESPCSIRERVRRFRKAKKKHTKRRTG
jgi:hypothetical protein